MVKFTTEHILGKYGDIIKEEVNIKEISWFKKQLDVSKVFKPVGSRLSQKFGKETWMIIKNGKQGNVEELGGGEIKVFDDNWNEWILAAGDYELVYEWLDGDHMSADGDLIVSMDLELTEELKKEWVSREISRFLNQMRKEADYAVDDKVVLSYFTETVSMQKILANFSEFLQKEALLLSIGEQKEPEWDIVSLFELDGENILFALKK